FVGFIVLILGLAGPYLKSLRSQTGTVVCVFKGDANSDFNGSCEWPNRHVTAHLSRPSSGSDWTGQMQGMFPEYPDDFEVTEGQSNQVGIAKTPFGWFPVTAVRLNGGTLTVTFSNEKEIPPTALDLQIVRRALEILNKESTWNRKDTRTCPARATTWSI